MSPMGSFVLTSSRLTSAFKDAVLLLLVCIQCTSSTNCGGYIVIHGQASGVIASPNYPNAYPNFTRCIWTFEASTEYQVLLTINFQGQQEGAVCNDYIEIRDGSATSDVLFSSCGTLAAHNVTSTARWLRILFYSDGSVAAQGLQATYSQIYAGSVINNISSPIPDCRSHEYRCSNKECISMSYRCDGYFDCGCADGGCDEDGCGGISMSYPARIAMGIGIGIGMFVSVCMLALFIERRHNWAKLKREKNEKMKNKRRR
ncbi:tolloid-like protein 2 [Haliotis rufescens]|uniref:tolloid-like protein 2 n=1 Tax=Haliotis rufescens TaxID=6454 RepID=UPI00201EBCB1|nr:tolloid-like protein 2 [Haliotis rufescens]